jgi:hypothetical protein
LSPPRNSYGNIYKPLFPSAHKTQMDTTEEAQEIQSITANVALATTALEQGSEGFNELMGGLLQRLTGGMLRDLTEFFTKEFARAMAKLLYASWKKDTWDQMAKVYEFVSTIYFFPETEVDFSKLLSKGFIKKTVIRVTKAIDKQELHYLKRIIHKSYRIFPEHRLLVRKMMGTIFREYITNQLPPTGLRELLEVAGCFARGLELPLKADHRNFLTNSIVSLHKDEQVFL